MISSLVTASLAGMLCAANAGVIGGRDVPSPTTLGLTTANALEVNMDGVGHILIIPYFSAQNGNSTIFSLTNSDSQNAKIVKVRFRGAGNGDSLFSLTLFIAPNDVWNAVITRNPLNGAAQLSSADTTCTLPSLLSGASLSFSTLRLASSSGSDLASQTLEGYIEVMTMADVPAQGSVASTPGSLAKSIQKTAGAVRTCDSASIAATQTNPTSELNAAALGLATPTTGLYGAWSIVNVPQTLTFSGEALALEARDSSGLPARANFVVFPQSDALAPDVDSLTSDPVFRSNPLAAKTVTGTSSLYVPPVGELPIVRAVMADFPDLSTPYLQGLTMPNLQSTLLHRALAANSISSEYATDPAIAAATDWVFSMPTRRYNVGVDTRQSTLSIVYSLAAGAGNSEYFSSANTSTRGGMVCTMVEDQVYFDRDSSGRHQPVGVANVQAAAQLNLCGAVAVMRFGSQSALAASVSPIQANGAASTNGWGTINTRNATLISGATVTPGVPVLGASFIRAFNPIPAPGVSGSYGMLIPFSFSRK